MWPKANKSKEVRQAQEADVAPMGDTKLGAVPLRERFKGYWGQVRTSAKLVWRWDRQGQHAIMGFGVTAGAVALSKVVPPEMAAAVYLGFVAMFLSYEITESWRIGDWAWPDIYGAMIGTPPGAIVGAVPHILF